MSLRLPVIVLGLWNLAPSRAHRVSGQAEVTIGPDAAQLEPASSFAEEHSTIPQGEVRDQQHHLYDTSPVAPLNVSFLPNTTRGR